jgi:hypothetical protein
MKTSEMVSTLVNIQTHAVPKYKSAALMYTSICLGFVCVCARTHTYVCTVCMNMQSCSELPCAQYQFKALL